ncbi:MAG: YsnF/AvaK domain-containing protein [Acidobacteriota bacterium]
MNKEQEALEAMNARTNEQGEIVMPLIAEEISIGKRVVETGGMRVHKTVREDVQTINEPILREHIEVERVEVNKYVETAPAIRYEGEVMIVPVLEEVVVTEKRLLLREEIRLVKRREEIANVQEVTLRREEISVEEFEAENPDAELQGR